MTGEASVLAVNSLFYKTSLPLLNLLYALIIIIIGLAIARLIRYVIVLILQALKLNEMLKAIKFTPLLEKAEIKRTPADLLGDLAYWLAIYFMVMGIMVVMGMPVTQVLDKIFSYTGVVLLAAVVLSLGSFLAMLIGGLVYVIAANFGISGAKTISKIIQYSTIIFAFLLALEQLGISSALLATNIGVIIGALGLAVAIAFGLGCKDIMADFVSNLIKGK